MGIPSLTQRHFQFATIVPSLIRQKDPNLYGMDLRVKLHLVINDQGVLLSDMVTPRDTVDRKPVLQLTKRLFGKLYDDKGYIYKKAVDKLREGCVSLVYKVRKNIKPEPLSDADSELLKKRMLINTMNKEYGE